jgi:hypothetical protein
MPRQAGLDARCPSPRSAGLSSGGIERRKILAYNKGRDNFLDRLGTLLPEKSKLPCMGTLIQ